MTVFREGKIDEDTVDCPRCVAFKGASREHSSSSFNLGQLTKRIHGESDEFDEEEARQAQRKDRRRRAPFYLESPIGFTFTWNRPLCAVLMLLGGGGGGGSERPPSSFDLGRPTPFFCADAHARIWVRLDAEALRCRSSDGRKTSRTRIVVPLFQAPFLWKRTATPISVLAIANSLPFMQNCGSD